MVSRLESFWNRGTRELGNGLFQLFIFSKPACLHLTDKLGGVVCILSSTTAQQSINIILTLQVYSSAGLKPIYCINDNEVSHVKPILLPILLRFQLSDPWLTGCLTSEKNICTHKFLG